MRPDELLTEISSIRGQAPGFIASDSRENALALSNVRMVGNPSFTTQ